MSRSRSSDGLDSGAPAARRRPKASTLKPSADLALSRRHSRYAASLLVAHADLPGDIAPRLDAGWTRESMLAWLDGAGTDLGISLRRLRKRVLLTLMERDLAGCASLGEVCSTMTVLAEVAIERALDHVVAELEQTLGAPCSEAGERQELVVVGMGKLGGGELNVSSDIDLIFVYPEEGDTRGEGTRSVSNHEFFAAAGKRLIAIISQPTDEGYVFRVDMRLRPWGDPGPLAMSYDALEQYLVSQGREWERYAWIKGRPLTGSQAAQQALAATVRPFVFRKYLDYGAYGAMRELHAQIREEVARRELANNVKLGPGGIREIEFMAQVFQLIRGGRETELQTRPTLQVLEILARKRLLTAEDVQVLSAAYDFLRRVEHRIQYLDDAQTHELPQDGADAKLLAQSMACRSTRAFEEALAGHRAAVALRFERIFSTQAQQRHPLASLWSESPGEDDAARLRQLRELGYAEPGVVMARLAGIRAGSRYQSLPESSRDRVDALVPRLLEQSARQAGPDATLARALDLIETISRRAAYLALLDEHPVALERLTGLVSASPWAGEFLNRHPVLLDELLDANLLMAQPDWRQVGQELRRVLMEADGDMERQMDALRESHHTQLFHLLLQDLAGALSVEGLADHLSDLADLVLQVTLELCWSGLRARAPALPEEPHFAIIAYGKLGGKELGYASDLDIVFLYDDGEEGGNGNGNGAVEAYARLAQRLNTWLTSRTAAGVLFETDLRLRPDGASGLMVSSLTAFRRYQRESAWVWEHQALTRARFCAGEATTGAAFEAERQAILRTRRDPQALAEEVRKMRKTMHEAHPNTSKAFDLKHDRGGMVDIEFIVQYLVLAHAHDHGVLARNDGNIALLGHAASLGLIDAALAEEVQEAYRLFRRRQHSLRLAGARYARVPRAEVAGAVRATQALWQAVLGKK
jgi:glutamate-ammonia-ligase adenylyltransferase